MAYCTVEDLQDYVLAAYLAKVEELQPGSCARHVEAVAAEIDEALAPRYALPLARIPASLRRISAVMAAYRAVGQITSLVTTDGSTGNEWIPLQSQHKQAQRDLEAIRLGKDEGLGLEGLELAGSSDGPAVVGSSPAALFGAETWRKF